MRQEAKLLVDKKIAALTKSQLRQGVLDGTIALAVWEIQLAPPMSEKLETHTFKRINCPPFFPPWQTATAPQPLMWPNSTTTSMSQLAQLIWSQPLPTANSPRQDIFRFVMVRKSTFMTAKQPE